MIELNRHIEVLLLENDCVIVPDFGGFMAHHVDARYDEADGSFIPPIRTIGFNPQLKINDSVLIHSYIEAYSLSYPEALTRVEAEVNELRTKLYEQGSYELTNVGLLSINVDGNIEFTPNEAGILTPAFYGLCSFSMPRLKTETIQQLPLPTPATPETEEQQKEKVFTENVLAIDSENDDDDNTINIRIAWIRNAVAVAAAVIAFFLIATPVSNNITGEQQFMLSSMKPSLAIDTPRMEETLEPVAENENTVDSVEQQEPTPVLTEKKCYTVVLASQVTKVNAETFVGQLHEQGYKDAYVYVHNHVVRVVCGSFASQEDAYQEAATFRQQEEFSQAWVMELNT